MASKYQAVLTQGSDYFDGYVTRDGVIFASFKLSPSRTSWNHIDYEASAGIPTANQSRAVWRAIERALRG
jgi:hypothetical protein